jgi:predicted phage-related endonuclease
MSKPNEPVPDNVLQKYITLEISEGNYFAPHVSSIAKELLERRRGEYICPQCGLRQTPQQDSDGGIPW